ncbi:hypothetical protein CEXT_630691 [Caerostris extrusa]|uniref:Uncharacterized protein n=1 Tax=Caerostris extrusa TaxID=172846 RepID=A0AAV4XYC0_CAEEX|nr:hypothetical protein CEXT_630691 [Caerostris extrusa]
MVTIAALGYCKFRFFKNVLRYLRNVKRLMTQGGFKRWFESVNFSIIYIFRRMPCAFCVAAEQKGCQQTDDPVAWNVYERRRTHRVTRPNNFFKCREFQKSVVPPPG